MYAQTWNFPPELCAVVLELLPVCTHVATVLCILPQVPVTLKTIKKDTRQSQSVPAAGPSEGRRQSLHLGIGKWRCCVLCASQPHPASIPLSPPLVCKEFIFEQDGDQVSVRTVRENQRELLHLNLQWGTLGSCRTSRRWIWLVKVGHLGHLSAPDSCLLCLPPGLHHVNKPLPHPHRHKWNHSVLPH